MRWNVVLAAGKACLQIIQVAILARWLAPVDFGLLAITASCMALAQMASDLGVGAALIHHGEVTRKQFSSLFWINLIVAIVLGVGMVAIASLAHLVYSDDRIITILMLLSPVFLLSAPGQLLRSMAEKRLDFKSIAVVEIMPQLLSFGCTVYMVTHGFGVYSQVLGALLSAGTGSVMAWMFLRSGRVLMMRLEIAEVSPMLRFGGWMTVGNVIGTLNGQIETLLGGKLLGANLLGQFNLPRDLTLRLSSLINPIFTRVAFPLLSEMQHRRDLMGKAYGNILGIITFINFPLYTFLAVESKSVIALLLGDQWIGAEPILVVLSFWAAIRSTANPVGSLMNATGNPRLECYWNVGIMPILVASVLIGCWLGGAIGLAWSLLVTQIIFIVPVWIFLVRPACGMELSSYLSSMFTSLIPVVCAAIASIFILSWFPIGKVWLHLLMSGCVFVTVYLAVSWRFNRLIFFDLMKLFLKINKRS